MYLPVDSVMDQLNNKDKYVGQFAIPESSKLGFLLENKVENVSTQANHTEANTAIST